MAWFQVGHLEKLCQAGQRGMWQQLAKHRKEGVGPRPSMPHSGWAPILEPAGAVGDSAGE